MHLVASHSKMAAVRKPSKQQYDLEDDSRKFLHNASAPITYDLIKKFLVIFNLIALAVLLIWCIVVVIPRTNSITSSVNSISRSTDAAISPLANNVAVYTGMPLGQLVLALLSEMPPLLAAVGLNTTDLQSAMQNLPSSKLNDFNQNGLKLSLQVQPQAGAPPP